MICNFNQIRSWQWLALVAASGLGACSSDSGSSGEVGTTGLFLTADVVGGTDTARVRFSLTPVDCESGAPTGDPRVTEEELEDVFIPGGIGHLEEAPLDSASAHAFADHFESLPAGCYDVETTPVDEEGEPSGDCARAFKAGVEISEGSTTEVFLINQCAGADPGALDAISTLNHEPELEDLDFPDSKFGTCSEPRVVCATASDPDRDPLEFEWELSSGSPSAEGPTPVSRDEDPSTGAVTECVSFEPSSEGRYDLTVRVFDLLTDLGATVSFEDYLDERGYPSESRAEVDLFFYAGDCEGTDGGSGGTSSGGTSSGGTSAGGTSSGGSSSGGSSSGGTSAGGTSSGGSSSGGSSAGGSSTGGTGGTSGTDTTYDIEVRYLEPVSSRVESVFEDAARRWEEVIVADVADVDFSLDPRAPGVCGSPKTPALDEVVDDLVIFADVAPIDGPGGILGQASPCLVRASNALPPIGIMTFDSADLVMLEADGSLGATVLHEMGHVIGIGPLWSYLGLLGNPSVGTAPGTVDTFFSGALARAAFDDIGGVSYTGLKVPVENALGFGDGTGTRDAHWRESVFDNELMTGVVNPGRPMPISLVTVQSLADLGYTVDPGAAEAFGLSSLLSARTEETVEHHLEGDVLDLPIEVVTSAGRTVDTL